MKRIVAPDGVEAAGESRQTEPPRVSSRCMTKMKTSAVLLSGMVVFAGGYLFAQVQRPGEYPRGVKPSPMMNFFVTSEPMSCD